MGSTKCLGEIDLIASLLCDFHKLHGVVFNARSLSLTLKKVRHRYASEGLRFLTVALPRLGKAFDKALSANTPLSATKVGFKPLPGSELPKFLGEFFQMVLAPNGTLLQNPCSDCVRVIRLITYCFYKYEKLRYSVKQERQVVEAFEKAEEDLQSVASSLRSLDRSTKDCYRLRKVRFSETNPEEVTRRAQQLLSQLFEAFDPTDIRPHHGPGAVSTREKLCEKWYFRCVSRRIQHMYPYDTYFRVSLTHVCDTVHRFNSVDDCEQNARVVLVPKDSRGPRLISCEPLAFQFVQQGLSTAIRNLVETHGLTRWNVSFTDQSPNRHAAIFGSYTGRYATLDLKEASDRVSIDLVRLLFPPRIVEYLEACRSLATELPDGKILMLQKFAPMGSALCFPILALTVWAILTAGIPDTDGPNLFVGAAGPHGPHIDYDTRESIRVYGDDVIVPRDYALKAIEQLESFGLLVNRDKSCLGGLFRESCGMDAFNGVDVTPVRFKTPLALSPSPNVYESWIAYANQLFDRRCFVTYDKIVSWLTLVYGVIPSDDIIEDYQILGAPSLREVPDRYRLTERRYSPVLQKTEWKVRCVESVTISRFMDGWNMLLRYFLEGCGSDIDINAHDANRAAYKLGKPKAAFSVRQYAKRDASKLVYRWR